MRRRRLVVLSAVVLLVTVLAPASAGARDATVPGAPTNVVADTSDPRLPLNHADFGQIHLAWAAPDDGGSPVTSYRIVAHRDDGQVTTINAGAYRTESFPSGYAKGRTYTFGVQAYNAIGLGPESEPSPQIIVPATKPDAPAQPYAAHDGVDGVVVSWHPPADDGGAPITGYHVTGAATYQDGAVQPSDQDVDAGTRSVTFTGLSQGATYFFAVQAMNAVGPGRTAYPSRVTTGSAAPPTPPIDLGAVASGFNTGTITWSAPPDFDGDDGLAITSYRVVLRGSSGPAFYDTTETHLEVAGLVGGERPSAEVEAINAYGTSDYSEFSPNFTVAYPPSAPAITSVTSGDGHAVVQWTAPKHDGGLPITGYRISLIHDGTTTLRDVDTSGRADVTGLRNGTAYRVRIAATDDFGAGDSSAPADVTPVGVATGGMGLRYVSFDPPGRDTPRKLDQEWVRIRNLTGTAASLYGWTLSDGDGNVFHFGTRVVAGDDWFEVHTGEGTSGSRYRYWQRRSYVWDNAGETVTLRNARGTVVDRCTYTARQAPIASCG